MPKPLNWTTQPRKLSDLKGLPNNPRKITEAGKAQLLGFLDEFNLVDIPSINTDNTVISGNQRLNILLEVHGGDYVIDVRVPNRKLTATEVKRLALALNVHQGEFDLDILALEFDDIDLSEFGIEFDEMPFDESPDNYGETFSLKEGDKEPFQQMTFTLADVQAEQVKSAISDIKQTDDYKYCETMGNENSNGNALYLIIMQWAEQRK